MPGPTDGQLSPAARLRRLVDAIRRDPRDAEAWREMGVLYLSLDQPDDARGAFERVVALRPDDAMAHVQLASSRLAAGDAGGAAQGARTAIALQPALAPAHHVLGDALAAQGQHEAAAQTFAHLVELDPHSAPAHYNRALALDECGAWQEAARSCEAALALQPDLHPALAQLVFLKRRLCEWQGLEPLSTRLRTAVARGAEGITPFSFLAEPAGPSEQRRCAETWANSRVSPALTLVTRRMRPAGAADAVRVAFVSNGFRNHPTALLLVELIERLRDSPIAAVGFATSGDDGGALRARIAQAFVEFHDIAGLSHADMAQRIRAANIDVAIDLRGYGGGAVTEVFAQRPVPLQVNWLAYPGTSGAPFIDYLIADRQLVPDAQRRHYSEALLRLPHCFQPSDSTRPIADPPSRTACGLPEHGTVFASFNNSYKIAPDVFAAWLRVLQGVPDAVLWLLAGKDEGPALANLHRAASAAGVDPQRVIAMRKLPHDQYLTRYRHVDLFLDTWPYNAHTTASDALWAGCPVLTLPGETFASRVAMSLLHTLGLPELIASSVDDYVRRALVLGKDREARRRLKQELAQRRIDSPLFDMARFASDFSRAIAAMVQRRREGKPPGDIDL